ncbi:MAG: hypothetical protein ACPL7I_08990, partial [Myxococcota bacterium]
AEEEKKRLAEAKFKELFEKAESAINEGNLVDARNNLTECLKINPESKEARAKIKEVEEKIKAKEEAKKKAEEEAKAKAEEEAKKKAEEEAKKKAETEGQKANQEPKENEGGTPQKDNDSTKMESK